MTEKEPVRPIIAFRCDSKEKEAFEKECASLGIPMSSVLRRVVQRVVRGEAFVEDLITSVRKKDDND